MNIGIDDGTIMDSNNVALSSSNHEALRAGISMATDAEMASGPLTDVSPYAVYVIVLKMDDINKETESDR